MCWTDKFCAWQVTSVQGLFQWGVGQQGFKLTWCDYTIVHVHVCMYFTPAILSDRDKMVNHMHMCQDICPLTYYYNSPCSACDVEVVQLLLILVVIDHEETM